MNERMRTRDFHFGHFKATTKMISICYCTVPCQKSPSGQGIHKEDAQSIRFNDTEKRWSERYRPPAYYCVVQSRLQPQQ